MEIYPLKSRLVRQGDSLVLRLQESLARSKIRLRNKDIIAIASKVVATSERRVRLLSDIKPKVEAIKLGREYSLPPQFVQLIIDEADQTYGGVISAILTVKDGIATPNAGADRKNAPDDSVILWPRDAKLSAALLQKALKKRTGLTLGVLIVDSRVTPLRQGTVGLSLASVGFSPIKDFRGQHDLFGRTVRITSQALGDGIAAAAHLIMGEADESVQFVLVRGAPVEFDARGGSLSEKMSPNDCLYMSQIIGQPRRRRN